MPVWRLRNRYPAGENSGHVHEIAHPFPVDLGRARVLRRAMQRHNADQARHVRRLHVQTGGLGIEGASAPVRTAKIAGRRARTLQAGRRIERTNPAVRPSRRGRRQGPPRTRRWGDTAGGRRAERGNALLATGAGQGIAPAPDSHRRPAQWRRVSLAASDGRALLQERARGAGSAWVDEHEPQVVQRRPAPRSIPNRRNRARLSSKKGRGVQPLEVHGQ